MRTPELVTDQSPHYFFEGLPALTLLRSRVSFANHDANKLIRSE
jgi:hypothetical protein